jgi:hypothetical protein
MLIWQFWMSTRSTPCTSTVGVLGLVTIVFACTARADLPLSTARIFNGVNANNRVRDSADLRNLIGGGSSSLDVTDAGQSAVSSAAITPGPRPKIDLNMQASSSGQGAAGANASAELSYYLEVIQVSPFLVYRPATIPILISARGEASASGSNEVTAGGSAGGSVIVRGLGFTPVIGESIRTGVGPTSFDRTVRVDVPTGRVVRFEVLMSGNAGASAGSDNFNIPNASATAMLVLDPLFTFDQAAFNEQAISDGFEPFLLHEFFELQPSPDIAVPEPLGMVLLVLGAALMNKRGCR